MRIVLMAAAMAAVLVPAAASAADYHAPRPAPRPHVKHHYAPMPVYREVALPTIAPPKPLYYVPSPVYYVQHLDRATCGPCGGGYHAEPGRWVRHSQWPF